MNHIIIFFTFLPSAIAIMLQPAIITPSELSAPTTTIEAQKEEKPLKNNSRSKQSQPKEQSIDQLLKKYFKSDWQNAKKIMMCESGGRANAKGDIGIQFWQDGTLYGASYGLFQVRYLKSRPSPDKLVDPEFNIRYASQLQGWHNWKPWYTCAKKNNLL